MKIDGSSGGVPALRKAAKILDFVVASTTAPTAAEITRSLGLAKSSAHGLLSVMEELGIVRTAATGGYRVGPKLMSWAGGYLEQTNLLESFQNVVALDAELERYTLTMSTLDGSDVVYLACRNSATALGFTFRVGMRLPALFTATGKAILSTLPKSQVINMCQESWPTPLTSRSVNNYDELMTELLDTENRGYSVEEGQVRDGMTCIGAPIRDFTGMAVAGIAISMLESEATPAQRVAAGVALQNLAKELSVQLGHSMSL